MAQTSNLDATDRKILRILGEHGRIGWNELADAVSLSQTPTIRRVRRMEEAGLIEGYTARLNEARLVGSISVFVSVTLERQAEAALGAFETEIVKSPNVLSCFLMTGGADYLLRVVVEDLADYQRFLMGTLTRIPGVAHIQSSFALRPVLQRSVVPL
ncbi:Lrp/AsnC family transcriptional regulator [Lichenicoccus sp.]|uniref:Lrp/AsnC family transcriptional regulator n=1 Tax=Lichenicoccus sp. TaxID=2781899 RepID=UPI003D0EF8D3